MYESILRAQWIEIQIGLKTLSFTKLINLFQLLFSYWLSNLLKRNLHFGAPAALGIEPTTACNLRCPHCISGLKAFTRPIGRLQFENFQKVIDETHATLIHLILYFQGEPFLNPDFIKMVQYASKKNIFTMTSTNAHFLDLKTATEVVKSGLSKIIISMDGISQESYEIYRKEGKIDKVIEGIKNLVEAKKLLNSPTPFIDLQCIIFKHNEHEILEIKAFGKKCGVNRVSFKTAQIYDFANAENWLPSQTKWSRYKKEGTAFGLKSKMTNKCWKLWHSAEITWDGKVLPCCFDKDATYEMGNCFQIPFLTIWNDSEKYRNFRNTILKSRKEIEMCKNCTEGLTIWK